MHDLSQHVSAHGTVCSADRALGHQSCVDVLVSQLANLHHHLPQRAHCLVSWCPSSHCELPECPRLSQASTRTGCHLVPQGPAPRAQFRCRQHLAVTPPCRTAPVPSAAPPACPCQHIHHAVLLLHASTRPHCELQAHSLWQEVGRHHVRTQLQLYIVLLAHLSLKQQRPKLYTQLLAKAPWDGANMKRGSCRHWT